MPQHTPKTITLHRILLKCAASFAIMNCGVIALAQTSTPFPSPHRVACVGDSITWGVGATDSFNSYPSQLGRMLGESWQVENFGNSGKTALNVGNAAYSATNSLPQALAFKPDVVVIMLGTNDSKPQNWSSKTQFPSDYTSLVAKFQALPEKPRIILCTPPFVSGPRGDGINDAAILEEIPMIQNVAQQLGNLTILDVHAATQAAEQTPAQAAALFPDHVHPSNAGANILARVVYNKLTGSDFEGEVPPILYSEWSGFRRLDFEVAGRSCILVEPKTPLPGNRWVWRTEFFGIFANDDVALLDKGYYIGFMDAHSMFGAPAALNLFDKFYDYMITTYKLAPKVALEGLSRGGLYAFNWAIRHPDRVALIYGDAPVCDFKSWPGAKGKSKGSPPDWKQLLQVYGFATEADALAYKLNPIDNLAPLAKAKVPILGVYGEVDDTVPPDENILLLASRYQAMGGEIKLIPKPGIGHHPHGLPDPTPIVEFIQTHTQQQ